jgi:hypothetical protein
MGYWVYILRNSISGKYYCGQTDENYAGEEIMADVGLPCVLRGRGCRQFVRPFMWNKFTISLSL